MLPFPACKSYARLVQRQYDSFPRNRRGFDSLISLTFYITGKQGRKTSSPPTKANALAFTGRARIPLSYIFEKTEESRLSSAGRAMLS